MSDGIAGVLGDHYATGGFAPRAGWASDVNKDGNWGCSCGASGPVKRGERVVAHHRAHVAAAVADFLTSEAVVEVAADRHQWQGGYFCTCGHELNSPAGFSRHLARAALAAAVGVGES